MGLLHTDLLLRFCVQMHPDNTGSCYAIIHTDLLLRFCIQIQSRWKLAIPFVSKDVPSRSSEFAHPDVVIALTFLGYTDNYRNCHTKYMMHCPKKKTVCHKKYIVFHCSFFVCLCNKIVTNKCRCILSPMFSYPASYERYDGFLIVRMFSSPTSYERYGIPLIEFSCPTSYVC